MIKIVTISGKAEHGKDSTAIWLKEFLELNNKRVLIMHYADLLKFYATIYFGWNGEKDEKGRTLLQYIGTEKVRSKYPDYWVQNVINFVDIFQDDFDYVIIPDCRFPNECDLWRANNYDIITVNVKRLNYTNSLTKEQQQHASEISLDNYVFDYYIENETINDLTINSKKLSRFLLYRDKKSDISTLRKVIAIDFDGTITNEDTYPETSQLAEYCKETLDYLYNKGYVLILNTCRTGVAYSIAIQYLKDNNIYQFFSYFNENDPQRVEMFNGDCRKISADFYLDDRKIGGFEGWKYVYDYFTSLEGNEL